MIKTSTVILQQRMLLVSRADSSLISSSLERPDSLGRPVDPVLVELSSRLLSRVDDSSSSDSDRESSECDEDMLWAGYGDGLSAMICVGIDWRRMDQSATEQMNDAKRGAGGTRAPHDHEINSASSSLFE